MNLAPNQKTILSIAALLIWTLACRAATRLIIPDTPTPALPTPTATITSSPTLAPTLTPIPTPTALAYEASCTSALEQILADFIPTDQIISWNDVVAGVDIEYLVQYTIVDGELKTPLFFPVGDELEDQQEDRAAHDDIWKLYTRIIPTEGRQVLRGFLIFTDGPKNHLAAVNQSRKNPYKWDLNVDIADSARKSSLIYTLIHEQGHLITLSGDQVPVNLPVYRNPHDEEIYQREKEACPQYFTGEGCSTPDSYIYQFFSRFWTDLYAEWQEIDAEENDLRRANLLDRFYNTYQDQFLTDYAPINPAEDIAESFAFFILVPKPELDTIASEKILFFHEYPELIALRRQILENICAEFQT